MYVNVDSSEVCNLCSYHDPLQLCTRHFPLIPGWLDNTGTISTASISAPLTTASAASPLGSVATSAPATLRSNALLPLVYWMGTQRCAATLYYWKE